MIKRVVTITDDSESLGDKINDFISNKLNKDECIKDIKIIESYRRKQTKESYLVGGGTWTHQTVFYTAFIYVSEVKEND